MAISYAFTVPAGDSDGINWLTFEEAIKLNEKEAKPIMIDIYTDWCGWCKRMDATTFGNGVVAKYVNEKFYAVKFDAEQKGDIEFGGKTFKFVESGRRGHHELAAAMMNGRMSYPTTVFLNDKMEMIQPLAGYQDAPSMERIVKFIGSKAYLDTKWETYTADASKFELTQE